MPLVYIVIAGLEGLLAGSVVGLVYVSLGHVEYVYPADECLIYLKTRNDLRSREF